MTDDTRPPIYCYAEEQPGVDALLIVAISPSGQRVTSVEALDVNSGQQDIRTALGVAGLSSQSHRVEWVEEPGKHAGLTAALAASVPAPAPKPSELAARPSPATLQATQAAEHVCPGCSHSAVCIVAEKIRGPLAALHVTVSSCGGFETPLADGAREIAERAMEALAPRS